MTRKEFERAFSLQSRIYDLEGKRDRLNHEDGKVELRRVLRVDRYPESDLFLKTLGTINDTIAEQLKECRTELNKYFTEE